MVINNFPNNLRKDGEELLKMLDSSGYIADAAFWFYFPEETSWKLLLSFPDNVDNSPKSIYTTIQKAMSKVNGSLSISLDDVSIITPDSDLIKLLKTMFRTGSGINGIRCSNNVINGQFIADAYIYRLI